MSFFDAMSTVLIIGVAEFQQGAASCKVSRTALIMAYYYGWLPVSSSTYLVHFHLLLFLQPAAFIEYSLLDRYCSS